MNVSDIYGTLYSPGDGTINPDGLCQALTRSAKRAGAKVFVPFFFLFFEVFKKKSFKRRIFILNTNILKIEKVHSIKRKIAIHSFSTRLLKAFR